jgi:hypothetical protein
MKKFLFLPMVALLALPVLADTRNSNLDTEVIEYEEEGYDDSTLDSEDLRQERMEEKPADMIDYTDRTRTNRERKALNTGGDASDDQ